jgi:hypothetical protein
VEWDPYVPDCFVNGSPGDPPGAMRNITDLVVASVSGLNEQAVVATFHDGVSLYIVCPDSGWVENAWPGISGPDY